jgi:hypothetical protein
MHSMNGCHSLVQRRWLPAAVAGGAHAPGRGFPLRRRWCCRCLCVAESVASCRWASAVTPTATHVALAAGQEARELRAETESSNVQEHMTKNHAADCRVSMATGQATISTAYIAQQTHPSAIGRRPGTSVAAVTAAFAAATPAQEAAEQFLGAAAHLTRGARLCTVQGFRAGRHLFQIRRVQLSLPQVVQQMYQTWPINLYASPPPGGLLCFCCWPFCLPLWALPGRCRAGLLTDARTEASLGGCTAGSAYGSDAVVPSRWRWSRAVSLFDRRILRYSTVMNRRQLVAGYMAVLPAGTLPACLAAECTSCQGTGLPRVVNQVVLDQGRLLQGQMLPGPAWLLTCRCCGRGRCGAGWCGTARPPPPGARCCPRCPATPPSARWS